ncbi:MAG: hypothetical protein ACXW3C_00615 [Pyrinomonadaceae bacterium]
MADEPDKIEYPGSATLQDIENDLTVKEDNRHENLTVLEILPDDASGHRSGATLTPVPFGTEFGQLVLVEVPAGKLDDVKTAQKPNTFILSATIWIENKQTEVAAFRKPVA